MPTRRPTKIESIVLDNAKSDNPLSLVQLAKKKGLKPPSLHAAAQRCRRYGWLHSSTNSPSGSPDIGLNTREGRIMALIETIRTSKATPRIQAIKALEELARESGQGVGPPPPSTRDEVVERLRRILTSVEPSILRDVLWPLGVDLKVSSSSPLAKAAKPPETIVGSPPQPIPSTTSSANEKPTNPSLKQQF